MRDAPPTRAGSEKARSRLAEGAEEPEEARRRRRGERGEEEERETPAAAVKQDAGTEARGEASSVAGGLVA